MEIYAEPKQHEITAESMIALDKYIILDIIDNAGDYEEFLRRIPIEVTFMNRGCPDYIASKTNHLETLRRRDMIGDSIADLEIYCAISGLEHSMTTFYNKYG